MFIYVHIYIYMYYYIHTYAYIHTYIYTDTSARRGSARRPMLRGTSAPEPRGAHARLKRSRMCVACACVQYPHDTQKTDISRYLHLHLRT